ncbi:outer membrane beta-barrel protein [Devosia rhodophyticola]|uniref:Outer membrane beta-barrel protein n=1 Tax=Devosia rhodophyticola TaxID=3026423 RepID=A0ABY7YWH5_9HYPH|nr:outer membrane beta-barrel protein [Devosia rhodophyticola]WDR05735.1 outer membrane beta-barrel protein [Devosia rhodophyticola]
MQKSFSAALVLSACIAIFSTAAQAQDGGWVDPSSSVAYGGSAFTWDGFYAGGSLGYGFGSVTSTATGTSQQNDMRGFGGGAQAGFNFSLGGFILGGEIDGQFTNINHTQTVAGITNSSFGLDYYGTARARAGLAYNQFMPFITAGYAIGRGTGSYSQLGGTFSQSQNHSGWTAGVGVEYAASEQVSIKLEYDYTDLGTQTYFSGAGAPTDTSFRFGAIRLGANFHF